MAEYGFAPAFLNHAPEIKKLVKKATAAGWEMDKFLDALKTTKWWKARTDSQKRFDIEIRENPKEIQGQLHKAYSAIWLIAARMGVKLSHAQVRAMGKAYVRNDMSEDALREAIGIKFRYTGMSGQANVARAELKEIATNYGVGVTKAALDSQTRNILMGRRTVADFEEYYRGQAERLFPAIANQLDKGFTVRQILDPYLQIAAEETGINPTTINITSGKWLAPVQYVPNTPGTGSATSKPAARPMTFDEWTSKIRTDTQYGWDKSQNAQKAASVLSTQLMEAFGARG
jgi:hypothetical protein